MARKSIPVEQLMAKFSGDLRTAIKGASPLACALVTTAFIENALITLLSNFFTEGKGGTFENLLKPGQALGSLASCADVAYCLGFINAPMLKNIRTIGDIRNSFAHSHELIDFDHADLAPHFAKLTLPTFAAKIGEGDRLAKITRTNRSKFIGIASLLIVTLTVYADDVERREPSYSALNDLMW